MQQFLQDVSCFLHETTNILSLTTDKNVFQVSCRFNVAQFEPALLLRLPFSVQLMVNKAVMKRQAEFIAGRYCVMRALTMLTGSKDCWVINRKDHSPIWPKGIVGSISHSKTIATAIVASQHHIRSAGIDIESLISDQQARHIASEILAGDTIQTCDYSFSQFITLLFSAKETLFKALYPILGKMMSFSDAFCTRLDPQQNICRLALQNRSDCFGLEQSEFDIAFAFSNNSVMTRLLIPAV